MNTADTLSNQELIEQLKTWKDRKKTADRCFYDLKKEFDRRIGVDAIMDGQQEFPLPFNEIIKPEEV